MAAACAPASTAASRRSRCVCARVCVCVCVVFVRVCIVVGVLPPLRVVREAPLEHKTPHQNHRNARRTNHQKQTKAAAYEAAMLGKLRESAGIAETADMRLAARERAARADRYDGFDMNVRGGSDGGGLFWFWVAFLKICFVFCVGTRAAPRFGLCVFAVFYMRVSDDKTQPQHKKQTGPRQTIQIPQCNYITQQLSTTNHSLFATRNQQQPITANNNATRPQKTSNQTHRHNVNINPITKTHVYQPITTQSTINHNHHARSSATGPRRRSTR